MEKTVIELFAGVGGFRVGLNNIQGFDDTGRAIENRDWNFVWANQWEPSTKTQHAYDCYCTRFGRSESHSNIDISKVDKTTIPNHSLLVGGFPCQDYSVARSLSGEKGIEGKKGVLFWEIADIIKIKHTPFILLENVDRLLKSPASQRGRDFGIMLRTFNDLGYNVEWRVINAADYGCAQRRRRVFIFAWNKNTQYNKQLLTFNKQTILLEKGLFAKSFSIDQKLVEREESINLTKYIDTVEMTSNFSANFNNTGIMIDGNVYTIKTTPIYKQPITLNEVREKKSDLDKYFLTEEQNIKFKHLRDAKKVPRTKPNGEHYMYSEGGMDYPDSLDKPGRTMLTSESSVNRSTHVIEDYETGKLRFITPIEAERLQHFPDNWTQPIQTEKRRYFMMGNALVTKIINLIEPVLAEIITNE